MTDTIKIIVGGIAGGLVVLLLSVVLTAMQGGESIGSIYNNVRQQFDAGIDVTGSGDIKVDGTTVIDASGNIDAPITSSTGTFSSILDTNGGFVEGGQLTISTTSATYTLTQAEMQDVKVISIADTESAAQTFTLPATSTMTTMIPTAGDAQSWIIDNLHTAAATTSTFAAGTGIDIDGLGANDDVINGAVSGMLVCWRLVSTDVRCSVREHVDAG